MKISLLLPRAIGVSFLIFMNFYPLINSCNLILAKIKSLSKRQVLTKFHVTLNVLVVRTNSVILGKQDGMAREEERKTRKGRMMKKNERGKRKM